MFKTLSQLNKTKQPIFLRADLNVPLKDGEIIDDTRIKKVIPTLEVLLQKTDTLIIATHIGRPKTDKKDNSLSTIILKNALEKYLNCSIQHISNFDAYEDIVKEKGIYLLENVRFKAGELENDTAFAKKLLGPCGFYVNDAFSCSHRAHASVCAIAKLVPAYAGLLFEEEVKNLSNFVHNPQKPTLAIIGGSKVSTKAVVLKSILEKVDYLVIGGAMANTFLKAKEISIGQSLFEEEFVPFCKEILVSSMASKIVLPVDFYVGKDVYDKNPTLENIKTGVDDGKILDFGAVSVKNIFNLIEKSNSVLWNGPLGVYEYKPYDFSSVQIAQKIAERTKSNNLYSLVGGGDTIAVLNANNYLDSVSYASTSGGAFLEYFEGKKLPGLEALEQE